MYQARWRSESSDDPEAGWQTGDLIVVRPNHDQATPPPEEPPVVLIRASDDLETLEQIGAQLGGYWRGFDYELPFGLVRDAVYEAATSDCLFGDVVETLSPLGGIDDVIAGQRRAEWGVLDALLQEHGSSSYPRISVGEFLSDGGVPVVISTDDGSAVSAAMIFGRVGFLVPVPPNVDELQVRVQVGHEYASWEDWALLDTLVDDGIDEELILWRVYSGEQTWIRDVVTRSGDGIRTALHAIKFAGLEGVGLVAGKVLRRKARKLLTPRPDPTFDRRLMNAEEIRFRDVADGCPRLGSAAASAPERGLVVVHGTMGTALPLAGAALAAIAARDVSMQGSTQGPPSILRFEHDTWLSLNDNASTLAALINQSQLKRVSFLAHSRGGLVAARTLEKLTLQGRQDIVIDLVTLGTPFEGTPVALTARVALELSHVALGSIRTVGKTLAGPAGGAVIDASTRLIALALPYAAPTGIRVMEPGSEVLPSIVDHLPASALTFAGQADGSRAKVYGVSSSLMQGVGRGAFNNDPNDLVCSVRSALAGRTTGPVLDCDHFDYLNEQEVQNMIAAVAARL